MLSLAKYNDVIKKLDAERAAVRDAKKGLTEHSKCGAMAKELLAEGRFTAEWRSKLEAAGAAAEMAAEVEEDRGRLLNLAFSAAAMEDATGRIRAGNEELKRLRKEKAALGVAVCEYLEKNGPQLHEGVTYTLVNGKVKMMALTTASKRKPKAAAKKPRKRQRMADKEDPLRVYTYGAEGSEASGEEY